jgi:hypothetical protein
MRFVTTVAIFLLLSISVAAASPTTPRPQYDIQAAVSLDPAVVEGTVTVLFTNDSDETLRDVAVMLFPNRFSQDGDLNDLARPMVYPEEEFEPGGISVSEVLDDGYSATYVPDPTASWGTAIRISIAPLEPGATRRIRMRFRTEIPHRFGSFGEFEHQLTMVGGWHPYLASLGRDGAWKIDAPPEISDFQVTLQPKSVMQLVLNGKFSAGDRTLRAFVPEVAYLSLIASPRLLRARRKVGSTTVTLLLRPKRFEQRIVPGPDVPSLIMNAAEDIVANPPTGVGSMPGGILLVEAPLRVHLVEAGEGMVVISDRLLRTLGPLREFHEAHLAQGIYREVMRRRLSGRESPRDYGWVAEGLSHEMAGRYMDIKQPERRLLTDWLNMFDFLAAVDRFEKVPKIPFVTSYFEQIPNVDPTRDRILTYNAPRPPGRVILSKLRESVGDAEYESMINHCLADSSPLRQCAAAYFPGRGFENLLDSWNAPYPSVNYRLGEIDFNQRDGGSFRTDVEVHRESSRPITEPVKIRLRTIGGADVDVQWNSQGDVALLSEKTSRRVYQVAIDPDEKLIETRRDDNAWWPRLEFLLDGADIQVSSTDFGFGANFISRIYQDYRKDLALTVFYTNRGLGFAAGPRFHFGEQIDVTRYRHNIHLFYSFVDLDDDFDELARPGFVTKGHTASFGFRYDYTDVFYDQNPSLQRRLRVYADWHDGAFGSDYDFINGGYVASVVFPILSPRTLVGLQLNNGFSHAFGDSAVPNQELFSRGGARSIRGIRFGDKLGRNIAVVTAEVRRSIYPELDWNLLDLLTLRRTQFRVFADSGNVSNSAGRVYDVTDWAVGIGAGFGLVYEAAGFFPAIAYLEIATRVDDSDELGDIQVLFGTKQAF